MPIENKPMRNISNCRARAAGTKIPGWLASQYKDAAKGDLVLVDYKYDDVDPEFTGEDLYSQDFETVEKDKDIVLEGWEQVTLKGDKKWQGKIYSNNGYAQFSANNFEGEVSAVKTDFASSSGDG